MSQKELAKLFPLKVFLIVFTFSAPLGYWMAMFAYTFGLDYPDNPSWLEALTIALPFIVMVVGGWVIYFRKKKRLLNK